MSSIETLPITDPMKSVATEATTNNSRSFSTVIQRICDATSSALECLKGCWKAAGETITSLKERVLGTSKSQGQVNSEDLVTEDPFDLSLLVCSLKKPASEASDDEISVTTTYDDKPYVLPKTNEDGSITFCEAPPFSFDDDNCSPITTVSNLTGEANTPSRGSKSPSSVQ